MTATQTSSAAQDVRAALTAHAKTLIMYENGKKAVGLSFFLWLFLALLGAHRFYNSRPVTAVLMVLLTLVSGFLALAIDTYEGMINPYAIGRMVLPGELMFIPIIIWILIDGFLIPGWVRHHNNMLAYRLGVM